MKSKPIPIELASKSALGVQEGELEIRFFVKQPGTWTIRLKKITHRTDGVLSVKSMSKAEARLEVDLDKLNEWLKGEDET